MEFDNQQNKPTYNVHKKKPRIGLYDDLSTTTQSPQALNTPTYNTSLSSSLPINNTNCLINTSSLPTNNKFITKERRLHKFIIIILSAKERIGHKQFGLASSEAGCR